MHEFYSFGKRSKCFDVVQFNSRVFPALMQLEALNAAFIV